MKLLPVFAAAFSFTALLRAADLSPDTVKFNGLPPDRAAQEATLPPGFAMKLFAAEPDIVQPIAFCLDDRARLWVVESHTYPQRAKDGEGRDRILVFEDKDGDGHFDQRTVFIEGLNLVSGIEVGFGGVFVGAAPQLLFIPISEGRRERGEKGDEPKPAGPPQVLLDGWGYEDTHETLNTFTWGPDGWLYGCHGVFTKSKVGKPGKPDADRVKLDAGVWRYQPVRGEFEVFSEGTSNPWGIDFDARGQCIVEACVIPHLYHMIQGGRSERQAGPHANPYTYDDLKTIADHRHYLGDKGPHAGNGKSDAAGGGHAHAGLLIYQGESWPEPFRGKYFMNNIHGARINMDAPEQAGSGLVAHHGADFINFNDSWSQILNLLPDQDGSVFMIDWYDKQQCHDNNPAKHDQGNGRIFKVVYNGQKTTPVDLAKKNDDELAALAIGKNEWLSRHARRLLQERFGAEVKLAPVSGGTAKQVMSFQMGRAAEKFSTQHGKLAAVLRSTAPAPQKLRALWALHVTAGLTKELATTLLHAPEEELRAWTIQCLSENDLPWFRSVEGQTNKQDFIPTDAWFAKEFARLAATDPSPMVRLYLASAAQRIPVEQRLPILEPLLTRAEDAKDINLPLMEWYALEPVVAKNPAAAAELLGKVKFPKVGEFIARRMAATAQ